MIRTILIANRSEIALRVQATCHAMGIKTVAIYSPEDMYASYVYNAHEAYKLSKSGFAGYLNQEEIISIALKSGADAIHPGYGFLSENSNFAQKVLDAGIIWVGPSPESIKLMGDKGTARDIMVRAGVPIVPGITIDVDTSKIEERRTLRDAGLLRASAFEEATDIITTEVETEAAIQEEIKREKKEWAQEQAGVIGYPVILKDPKSGGGKAMRRIDKPEDFESSWNLVCSEAAKYTGSKTLVLEKYITHGRHIEVQVIGDGKNFIHAYERECSIQRRHQKIIEEAPCLFLSTQTRDAMYKAAVCAAQSVNYNNIGTVEFIVTPDQNFYFLEMNTRLQVEHSVTEMTTGLDLVALQIEIAQTGKLNLKQEDISQHAHAIQCRIYAENPAQKFAPSTGIINNLVLPISPFMRIDHDLEEGTEITPFFDPMIAKITTWGADRTQAISNMRAALEHTNIQGISTNIGLLVNILESNELRTGAIHTQLLNDKNYLDAVCRATCPSELAKPACPSEPPGRSRKGLDERRRSASTEEIKEIDMLVIPNEIVAALAVILYEKAEQESVAQNQKAPAHVPVQSSWKELRWK